MKNLSELVQALERGDIVSYVDRRQRTFYHKPVETTYTVSSFDNHYTVKRSGRAVFSSCDVNEAATAFALVTRGVVVRAAGLVALKLLSGGDTSVSFSASNGGGLMAATAGVFDALETDGFVCRTDDGSFAITALGELALKAGRP